MMKKKMIFFCSSWLQQRPAGLSKMDKDWKEEQLQFIEKQKQRNTPSGWWFLLTSRFFLGQFRVFHEQSVVFHQWFALFRFCSSAATVVPVKRSQVKHPWPYTRDPGALFKAIDPRSRYALFSSVDPVLDFRIGFSARKKCIRLQWIQMGRSTPGYNQSDILRCDDVVK